MSELPTGLPLYVESQEFVKAGSIEGLVRTTFADYREPNWTVEDEGVLLKLLVGEGETVKLGAPVAIIGKAGEGGGLSGPLRAWLCAATNASINV